MDEKNLKATIQKNYTNSSLDVWFFQTPFKEFIFFNILWIILLLLLLTYFLKLISSLIYRKNIISNLSFFVSLCAIAVLFGFGLSNQNKKTLMYISYPNSSEKVSSSIEMFITDAQKINSSVKEFNQEDTYVYFKNNILDLLKKDEKSSVLYNELETLFQKYKYIPVAIIKDNSLKSLSYNDFIQIKS